MSTDSYILIGDEPWPTNTDEQIVAARKELRDEGIASAPIYHGDPDCPDSYRDSQQRLDAMADQRAPFTKVLHVGKTDAGNVFVKIEWSGKRLSFTGVEGPKRNGDCRGSCGQIDEVLKQLSSLAASWCPAKIDELYDLWKRWHLNDMRAGCEHQRAEGWDKRPIDPSKPTDTYGKHYEGQTSMSWNMLTWVTRKDHPEGLLSHPCSVCGYRYGSAWLKEEVPADVLDQIAALPDTDVTPAWV